MKILILGGTGAMGTPLQKFLFNQGHEIHVTSREIHEDNGIHFHCGNAHDNIFLYNLLQYGFDSIVDFMSYTTNEFAARASVICKGTGHYIFISSSRVYSPCEGLITEEHARLLDVCKDRKYLMTDEYALAKARQENILKNSGNKNWTIVRPSLTYNTERLQYAIGEKEDWLYRFQHNEKIVFPSNLSDIITTMSYGDDVANAISLLVGNKKALEETVHIAGAKPITWENVNKIYNNVLEEKYGRKPSYFLIDDWQSISRALGRFEQIKYARGINRQFDNSKLYSIIGEMKFIAPEEGLKNCLLQFLEKDREFKKISWTAEACYNMITKDKTNLTCFTPKERMKYLIGKYTPYLRLRSWKREKLL